MSNDQRTVGTEQPATVQTGSHDLVVDHHPLATGWDGGRREVELKLPGRYTLDPALRSALKTAPGVAFLEEV